VQEACVQGIPTRSTDGPVDALGMTGISKSQVSRQREEIDERVTASSWRIRSGRVRYRARRGRSRAAIR
jgi:transposase-like protein